MNLATPDLRAEHPSGGKTLMSAGFRSAFSLNGRVGLPGIHATMRCLLALPILFLFCSLCQATDIYFASAAAGSNNGTSCANAYAVADATHGINVSGNWSAGNNLHLCGTITGTAGAQAVIAAGSGTSGGPVTVKFETGAVLTAPYWSANGAIQCNGYSYITVDGGTNGIIQNTASGGSLTYNNQATAGVYFTSCPHSEIKNVTVQNIYIHTAGSTRAYNTGAYGIFDYKGDFGLVHNNTVNNAYAAVAGGYGTGSSITSFSIYNNNIDYACHMIDFGDGSAGTASGVNIYNNVLGPHNEAWSDPSLRCHQDGIFLNAFNSGSSASDYNVYSNIIAFDTCEYQDPNGCFDTAYIDLQGKFSNVNVFNNVMYTTVTGDSVYAMVQQDNNDSTGNGTTCTNISFYNNTFGGDDGNGYNGGAPAILVQGHGGSQTGFIAENNIFVNVSQAGVRATNGTLASTFTTIDHNLYYNFSNSQYSGAWAYISDGSNAYSTLAAMQAAGWEAHGLAGQTSAQDPLFNCQEQFNAPPGNCYQLQAGSAAIGLGVNLMRLGITALGSDIAGVARPATGSWSAGSYQFPASLAPPANLVSVVQ